jgi:hypothetical protein
MSSSEHSSESDNEVSKNPITYSSAIAPDGDIERIGTPKDVQQFLMIDHTANQRSGSKISAIWHHGVERRRLDDGSMDRY